MKRYLREWSVAFTLAALLLVLAIFAPGFFRPAQVISVLTGAAPLLVVACGAALVIICRQIDISVGSQFALCSVLAGLLVRAHWSIGGAALASIFAGAFFGGLNGALVAGLGIPSIVVTLATMVTWREALRWSREGEFVRDLPETLQWFGLSQPAGQTAVIILAALVFLLLILATQYSIPGRFIYAVGSNAEAARLAGIRPRVVTFLLFVLMGALAGFGAILNAVRFADVDPKTGTGLELQAISAAVVGGVAISGGRGHLWGVLIGVLLLACVAPALVFLKLRPEWEKALQGCIILIAVAGQAKRRD